MLESGGDFVMSLLRWTTDEEGGGLEVKFTFIKIILFLLFCSVLVLFPTFLGLERCCVSAFLAVFSAETSSCFTENEYTVIIIIHQSFESCIKFTKNTKNSKYARSLSTQGLQMLLL